MTRRPTPLARATDRRLCRSALRFPTCSAPHLSLPFFLLLVAIAAEQHAPRDSARTITWSSAQGTTDGRRPKPPADAEPAPFLGARARMTPGRAAARGSHARNAHADRCIEA